MLCMHTDNSVVAMAVGAHSDIPFAAKFFADRSGFDAETAARQEPALAAFAPQIIFVHDPAALDRNSVGNTDRYGRLLPPCIVMPRGESLVEWTRRATADKFQAVTVCTSPIHALHLPACVSLLCNLLN